jgi:hypothetical protein
VSLVVPLAFALSTPAWGVEDCGLMPGDHWWIVKSGLLICDTDGRVVDAKTCEIPVGVTLSLRVEEVAPPTILTIVPPCGPREEGFIAREGAKARSYLKAKGVLDVEVVVAPCAATPSITAKVKP